MYQIILSWIPEIYSEDVSIKLEQKNWKHRDCGTKRSQSGGGGGEMGGGGCLFSSLRASQGSRVWLEQLLLRVLVPVTY